MAIELIAKIKPKNNGSFPMVDAADVEMPDGLRVPEAIDKKLSKAGWSANKLLVTDSAGKIVETDIPEIPDGGIPEDGWAPNKYLGTDSYGKVVATDLPDIPEGGLSETGWPANKLLVTDALGNVVATDIPEIPDSGLPESGWNPDKYLGTDSNGNVVEKDAPSGGLTEVSWEDIQDKPFYTEGGVEEVFPEQTVEGFSAMELQGMSFFIAQASAPYALVKDTTYKIRWCETEYELTAFEAQSSSGGTLIGVGNQVLAGGAVDETPFGIMYDPAYSSAEYFSFLPGESHKVGIYIDSEVVHPLDAKFIPEAPVPTAIDLSGYESEGRIVESFDDGSTQTTTIEFDSVGRPTKITDNSGNVTTLKW